MLSKLDFGRTAIAAGLAAPAIARAARPVAPHQSWPGGPGRPKRLHHSLDRDGHLEPGGEPDAARRRPPPNGWFGWVDDPVPEDLRNQWFDATDPATQAEVATEIQIEAFRTLPYVPLGRINSYVAYSSKLTGMPPCAVAAYWNIGRGV